MVWQGIHGHDSVREQLERSIRRGRLASSFLFVGPPGIGKYSFALRLAQAMLCESSDVQRLEACERCSSCRQVLAQTHPDLITVAKPKDKSFIPVESFIGDREHRMQQGLCHDIALKSFHGKGKVAIIDDADWLNQEGANCLLKTLEEPPPDSTLILISSHPHKQLPTIQSRCQIIRFQPLPVAIVAEILVSQSLVEDPREANELAQLAQGSVHRAMAWRDPTLRAFRAELLAFLSEPQNNASEFAKSLTDVVDQAGKDAPARRQRLHLLVDQAADFYWHVMRNVAGHSGDHNNNSSQEDVFLRTTRTAATSTFQGHHSAVRCLDRCLQAHLQISANANLATLIHSWLDDLGRCRHI